jgi:hypothetical protein
MQRKRPNCLTRDASVYGGSPGLVNMRRMRMLEYGR